MTSRYRVEYSLKSHRRDYFIEWIKSLLAVPFVLHGDQISYLEDAKDGHDVDSLTLKQEAVAANCSKRYLEVFSDVERLIDNTILLDEINDNDPSQHLVSRLRKLVPSIGRFFTSLPLKRAYNIEDERRGISKRRLVAPSFNDVRVILNTAQVLSLGDTYHDSSSNQLKLITFDGDVTLYEDGKSLTPTDPIVTRLVKLLSLDFFVAVVTAAGYPGQSGAENYYQRLKGLIDLMNLPDSPLSDKQKSNLLIMGAESNYLFRFDTQLKGFKFLEGEEWYLPMMKSWNKDKIEDIMETAYQHLLHLQTRFDIGKNTTIIRKARSVGIIPNPGYKILREFLEEMVLSCSAILATISTNPSGKKLNVKIYSNSEDAKSAPLEKPTQEIRVCAFNGGSDVWVDIGDKSLGVEALQNYLWQSSDYDHEGPILKSESLHVGDQFASVGANDFKARLSATTAWIANPRETVELLDDLICVITKQPLTKR